MKTMNQLTKVFVLGQQDPIFAECPLKHIQIKGSPQRFRPVDDIMTVTTQGRNHPGVAAFIGEESQGCYPVAKMISS